MQKNRQPLFQRRQFIKNSIALAGVTIWPFSALAKEQQNWPELKVALIEGLSGPFGNTGDAVYRNLLWGSERINALGGVVINGHPHRLTIVRFDSQGSVQGALSMLKAAIDQGIRVITQGNSSAVASALIAAISKHNMRMPKNRLLFLNYSAVETTLTNEACSFWHFRFDAHADMRLNALFQVLKEDLSINKIYLIGQDYSFGRYVLQRSREMINQLRPDIEIVGHTTHPTGLVKDFTPYASKIKSSGAQAIVTGNWGNDLNLLVRATRDIGLNTSFYTFYANDLGSPTAMGDAGVSKALAVTEWHPNASATLVDSAKSASNDFYNAFITRFPNPSDDFIRLRMQVMLEMLAKATTLAGQIDATAIATVLEGMPYDNGFHQAYMRKEDHQLQQTLYVVRMEMAGSAETPFPVEGSPYGFQTLLKLDSKMIETAQSCNMLRPS